MSQNESPASSENSRVDAEPITEIADIDESDCSSNSLELFLAKITENTTPDMVEGYVNELGLFQTYNFSGTGFVTYRVAADKSVADSYKPKKGTVVTIEFSKLYGDKLCEVVYFNEEKMIQGRFFDGTYTLTDYNNPEKEYMNMQVSSFDDIIAYEPSRFLGNNLLEELFLSINSSTTKEELMAYVNANELSFIERGVGNEEYITYDRKVMAKYGDVGSNLEVHFSEGILTKMRYCDYPVQYKTGTYLEFYSNYPHSDLNGFYVVDDNGHTQYSNAQGAMEAIHSLRK